MLEQLDISFVCLYWKQDSCNEVYDDGVSEVVDMSLPKLGFSFRFSFNKIWLHYVFSVLPRINSVQ